MLADNVIRIIPLLVRGLISLIKNAYKGIIFFGLYWLVIPITASVIYESTTNKSSLDFLPMVYLSNTLTALACVLALLTTLQSLIRKFKKDGSFNIFSALSNIKRNKKGFEAKLNDTKKETILLKSANELNGFFFGKVKGKYAIKPETTDGHILVIGGAGSGKTSEIAIPTLMNWKERVFAIDIKGELYKKTSQSRIPEKIKVFNPTDKTAYGYDPFYMLRNTDDIASEARSLALSICPLPPDVKDPYWITSAQNILTGSIIYFLGKDLNFSETMKLIKSKPIMLLMAEIMKSGNEKAIAEVSQYDGLEDKTLSAIFTELSNHITIFATNDDLQRALSGEGSCITPEDLENGYDIYCCIPEHKIKQWKNLLSMMVNQFLESFERREDGNDKPILFLIDEFARLGKIEAITNGLATLRSKKIQIALFVQSKSLLNAIYGKDFATGISDNCTYKAILLASDPDMQEWCSKLVGTYDRKKKGTSTNEDVFGIGKGTGTSTSTEEKRIIKPEEFGYLQDIVCVFPTGYRRLEKAPYYKDSAFKDKVILN